MISKNFLTIFIGLFFISSCVSYKKNLDQKRSYLLEHEKFRYELPSATSKPKTPVFPKIKYTTLENGLKIYVVENKSLPIASLQFVFKNGSGQDPRNRFGLINLTTKMLKESTQSRSSLKLAQEFAILGTEVSAITGKDSSYFNVSLLSNKLDQAFALMADMLIRPGFRPQDFKRVKIEHASSLLAKMGDPDYLAQVAFLKSAYGYAHPYGHPIKGTVKSVKNIQIQDIVQAYNNFFGPNNGAIIAVGDVSLEQVKTRAKQYFNTWRTCSWQEPEARSPQVAKSMKTIIIDRKNSPQTKLLLGRVGINAHDKKLPGLQILQQILSGGPNSRLDSILRETKGWTYGVNTWASPLLFQGPMGISTSIKVPHGSDALKEILDQLEILTTNLISDDELKKAKNTLLSYFSTRYSTVNKITSIIGDSFTYNFAPNRDQNLYQDIKNISKQDIMRVAKWAFQKNQFVAVAVGERETMEMPLANMDVGNIIIEQEEDQSIKQ